MLTNLTHFSKKDLSPRKELLHNIDPLYDQRGKRLFPDEFDTRVRAALRVGDWKIITGDPGRSGLHNYLSFVLNMPYNAPKPDRNRFDGAASTEPLPVRFWHIMARVSAWTRCE